MHNNCFSIHPALPSGLACQLHTLPSSETSRNMLPGSFKSIVGSKYSRLMILSHMKCPTGHPPLDRPSARVEGAKSRDSDASWSPDSVSEAPNRNFYPKTSRRPFTQSGTLTLSQTPTLAAKPGPKWARKIAWTCKDDASSIREGKESNSRNEL